jgi:3-hydroxyisobutyrate dehydrogenase-like beta-hydroxyacid dehydrogenase
MGSALAGASLAAGRPVTVWNRTPHRAAALSERGASVARTVDAGFTHGAAMVGADGGSATDFAARATPFLAAMTEAFGEFAAIIDSRDYAGDGQQSLEFSDLGDLLQASADQGVSLEVLEPVQRLIRRQIDGGHGADGFARIYEELRSAPR